MRKTIFATILVGGAVLIFLGIITASSFSSDLSRLETGLPTAKAIGLLIGGGVAAVVGLVGALSRPRLP